MFKRKSEEQAKESPKQAKPKKRAPGVDASEDEKEEEEEEEEEQEEEEEEETFEWVPSEPWMIIPGEDVIVIFLKMTYVRTKCAEGDFENHALFIVPKRLFRPEDLQRVKNDGGYSRSDHVFNLMRYKAPAWLKLLRYIVKGLRTSDLTDLTHCRVDYVAQAAFIEEY
jgi:hypothetical protein